MAYSPIAAGLLGAVAGAGDIAADQRKTAEADASAKKRYEWQKEIDLDYQSRVDELKFQREGDRLPETLRREGLINQGKTAAEIAKMNDPEYLKGLTGEAKAKHIEPADRDAEGRRLRNDVASLQLKNLQEDERVPKSIKDQAASLYKQADSLTTSIANAELKGEATPEGLAAVQGKLDSINDKIGGLLKPYRPASATPPPLDVNKYKVGGNKSDIAAQPATNEQQPTSKAPETAKAPSQGDVQMLINNPTAESIKRHDSYYGAGSARKIIANAKAKQATDAFSKYSK